MKKYLILISVFILSVTSLIGQGGYFRPSYIGWPTDTHNIQFLVMDTVTKRGAWLSKDSVTTLVGGSGGVTGRIDNYIQFGHAGGGLDQNIGLQYNDVTDVMRLDSALTINGLEGGVATTFKVLKTGEIVQDNPLNGLGVWTTRRIKPLQQDEGNVDWIESIYNADFFGDRYDNVYSIGWNLLGSTVEQTGVTGFGLRFEDHFAIDAEDHKSEMFLSFYDSTNTEYRPVFFNIDKGNKSNWFGNFQVGYSNWHDPRTQLLGEGNYFQIRSEADTAGVSMTLYSPRSLTTKGVLFYFHDVINQLQVSPFGTANTEFNAVGFPYARFDRLRATPTTNVAIRPTGWDSDSRFTNPTWPVFADSIAQYILVDEPDSVFQDTSGLICIITMLNDTICSDSIFYDDITQELCAIVDNDTTCVAFDPATNHWYIGNGSFTGDRTAFHDGHWLQFREGNRRTIEIHPDTSESTLKAWNKPDDNVPALELLGTQHQTRDIGLSFNGVTSGTHQRDYWLAMDQSEGALRLGKSTIWTNSANYFWSIYGQQDSMIIHKGLKIDGIVWDEDGDQGSTGQVLVAQGDGTLNWATGTGQDSIPINHLLAATAANTINNGNFLQEWQWNTLAGNTGLKLSSTSTAAASNTQKVFEISLSGANATSTQTTYGMYSSNTHTGTSSTNIAGYFTASGGTSNYGVMGVGTARGVYGSNGGNSGGYGVYAENSHTTGGQYGLFASSFSNAGAWINNAGLNELDNIVLPVLIVNRGVDGTHGAGLGSRISMMSDAATGGSFEQVALDAVWTDVTQATRTSRFDIQTTNSASTTRKFSIAGNGQLTLDTYGDGTHTGTATKFLAVDVNGNVIEEDDPGGPGGTDNIYTVSDSIDNEDRLVFVRNANTLEIELDTLASAVGADFMLTTQLPDTLLRAGTDASGNSFLHLRPLIVKQKNDATDGIFIESTTTADEAATLNLRGRQDGTDGISSKITFSNFDDDGGASDPTSDLAMIEIDRSQDDDHGGIMTLSTFKINGAETEHVVAHAVNETTTIHGFAQPQVTTAATSLTVSSTQQIIYATTSSGFTLTMTDADASLGMIIKLYAPNASSVTITGGSGDTVTDFSSNFNRPLEIVAFGANLWTVQN